MDTSTDIDTRCVAASQWSRPLRAVHLLLAIAVTTQLFVGGFMQDAHPVRLDSFGFMSREVISATILVLIALHWARMPTHPAEGVTHLFTWRRRGIRQVADEFWQALRWRRLPRGGAGHAGLSAFVHGFGLLAVTTTVAFGASFPVARAAGVDLAIRVPGKNIHDVFAVVVWTYWGGHLFATIVHSLLHQPVWQTMPEPSATSAEGTDGPCARLDA